jgi:hypothetical protein
MDKYQQAKWMVIVYFIIIIVTTGIVLYRYPQNNYFWTLMVGMIIWTLLGALSIWYSFVNDKIQFSIFFFVIFIGIYWSLIYYTLEQKTIIILNVANATSPIYQSQP